MDRLFFRHCNTERLSGSTLYWIFLLFFLLSNFALLPLSSAKSLEEHVVTAQRRAQDAIDVPISITTISSDDFRYYMDAGEDIRALSGKISSFYAESSNGRVAPRFYIRGLGNTDFDLAASQPVSVILDDVVLENVVLKSFPMFDIEQVEVLKGPQGSLFGRNTPAGIVKFQSVAPSAGTSGYFNVNLGLDDVQFTTLEGAIGFGSETVAVRFSGHLNDREDWITNTYVPGNNPANSDAIQSRPIDNTTGSTLGKLDEMAARFQVLVTPNDRLRILGNIHARDYEGSLAEFRANIFVPGTNDLADHFSRDSVVHDAQSNGQAYKGFGASLKIDYTITQNLELFTLVSTESTEGSSSGDIDGGAVYSDGTSYPGTIPFPSATEDGLDNLNQTTAEVRLAYDNDQGLTWQGGFYYFSSAFDINTDPGFAPPVEVQHKNNAFAVFGNVSYDVTDKISLSGGLRLTSDQKDLRVAANQLGQRVNRSLGAREESYDFAIQFLTTENSRIYIRLAKGFRAPTIQGRDIAFFGEPSEADPEEIYSSELGYKFESLDRKFRMNLAAFAYTITDQQLSAIGGDGNNIILVNADEGFGRGFEAEFQISPISQLNISISYSLNNTEIQDDNLQVGVCSQCTVLNPTTTVGTSTVAHVNGNSFPNAPLHTLFASLEVNAPINSEVSFFARGDFSYQADYDFFLYQSEEFHVDNAQELGVRLGLTFGEEKGRVFLFGRNITDEINVKGGVDFNNNTAFVNEPRIWGVGGSYSF